MTPNETREPTVCWRRPAKGASARMRQLRRGPVVRVAREPRANRATSTNRSLPKQSATETGPKLDRDCGSLACVGALPWAAARRTRAKGQQTIPCGVIREPRGARNAGRRGGLPELFLPKPSYCDWLTAELSCESSRFTGASRVIASLCDASRKPFVSGARRSCELGRAGRVRLVAQDAVTNVLMSRIATRHVMVYVRTRKSYHVGVAESCGSHHELRTLTVLSATKGVWLHQGLLQSDISSRSIRPQTLFERTACLSRPPSPSPHRHLFRRRHALRLAGEARTRKLCSRGCQFRPAL